jgi:ferric-dicitrate binding protein FerR (iron transport regulator)
LIGKLKNVMSEEHQIIGALLAKYPELDRTEQELLDQWLQDEEHQKFFKVLMDKAALREDIGRLQRFRTESEGAWENFIARTGAWKEEAPVVSITRGRLFSFQKKIMVACLLATIALSLLWLVEAPRSGHPAPAPQTASVDVQPGGSRARLTLADGSVVVLDNAKQGTLVRQGQTDVVNKNGQLIYQPGKGSGAVLYNTLTTLKGETYATVLSDGTKVWLNAGSSLRYPVAFDGLDRTVQITGEAYFEVAHNAQKPFHVRTGDMDVRVLGTHFNINAYGDEAMVTTTLLEGKVLVTKEKAVAALRPGQQATATIGEPSIHVVDNVDLDEVVAWKNGFFQFSNTALPIVMRQLARWYDVEVQYQGEVPQIEVVGKLPRNLTLSQAMIILKQLKVKYTVSGKKIIIAP